MSEPRTYVVITPVRDEEAHVEATFQSVCSQTEPPTRWIIVDDGSTDGTGGILDRLADEHPWIQVIHRPNRGFRKAGGGVMEAFYDGYAAIDNNDWEFLVKLDGDLTFGADYFQNCLDRFSSDPQLGIGGGEICHDIEGALKVEENPRFHVRGATKIYRKACWEAIGGLVRTPGWDTIDEVHANMLGWRSYSFPELRLVHHRPTGQADGPWRDRVKHGMACHIAGYHPLFIAASCLHRLRQRPYVVGSVAVAWGYLKGCTTGVPRQCNAELTRYIRRQQLRRLFGLSTIWK